MLPFTDAHLDIAWSSLLNGRDFVHGHPDAALGLPDLLAGGISLACATIFSAKFDPDTETAREVAEQQLAYYDALPGRSSGTVIWPADAIDVGTFPTGKKVCLVGLIEGCEPVETPDDLDFFYKRGVRAAGLTWNQKNKWAAGCAAEGGLTADGVELVRAMDRLNMVHDISHLSRTSVDDLFGTARGPVMASHVGADAIYSHRRNLTDAHLAEVARRGGVVGIVLFSKFLCEGRATMDDVVAHLMHMLEICGPESVGIGSDLDGGFSRSHLPTSIHTAADFPNIADALRASGVSEDDVAKVCGSNFRRLLTGVM
ncbi:MAG: membrane dipeptidase [Planctomycetota bacterium]